MTSLSSKLVMSGISNGARHIRSGASLPVHRIVTPSITPVQRVLQVRRKMYSSLSLLTSVLQKVDRKAYS